jgi:uncharacterized protein YbjT (DUF2867 family)
MKCLHCSRVVALHAPIVARSMSVETSANPLSSVGASLTAKSFYLRLKAQTERRLQMVGLRSLTVLRPAGIIGPRQPRRRGEEISLLSAALGAIPGVHIVELEDLP